MVSAEVGLLARLLFGGVLVVTGLNHFRSVDAMTGYAGAKGLLLPRVGVVGSGVVLVGGGGRTGARGGGARHLPRRRRPLPRLLGGSRGAATGRTHPLPKNVALAGGALGLLAAGGDVWAYGVGVGLL